VSFLAFLSFFAIRFLLLEVPSPQIETQEGCRQTSDSPSLQSAELPHSFLQGRGLVEFLAAVEFLSDCFTTASTRQWHGLCEFLGLFEFLCHFFFPPKIGTTT
jgi:hypothetical protein